MTKLTQVIQIHWRLLFSLVKLGTLVDGEYKLEKILEKRTLFKETGHSIAEGKESFQEYF